MTHAIIILAHKDFDELPQLVRYFQKDCHVFIHIDKKAAISTEEIERLKMFEQVKGIWREFKVNWGGYSILRCEMFMIKETMRLSDAEYLHIISAQDYPTRSLDVFLEFFERNQGIDFMQYTNIPNPRWEHNTFYRFQYFFPYDYCSTRKSFLKWKKRIVGFQRRYNLKRRIPDPFDNLYGGSQWISITRQSTQKILDYTQKKPSFYRRLWMTFAPEECYFPTVLVNLQNKSNIAPWNCRFIRWHYENGHMPANLGAEHFHYLVEKEYLLARKMEKPYCIELKKRIDKYLLQESPFSISTNGSWIYDGVLRYKYEEMFAKAVTNFCREYGISTAIDMGCGCGIYVAEWRRAGIAFAGYDANPYTPILSQLFLAKEDEPCGVADLTKPIDSKDQFDLVVCKDVMEYIPRQYESTAIKNLCKLSCKYILMSWQEKENTKFDQIENLSIRTREYIIPLFCQMGFELNEHKTALLNEVIQGYSFKPYYLFTKR